VANHIDAILEGARHPVGAVTGEFLASLALGVYAVHVGGPGGMAVVMLLVARLHASAAAHRRLAITDAATGALTRRAFVAAAERERRRAERSGRPLSIAYLDLDGLKSVNDRSGHRAGDRVLRAAANAVAGALRGDDAVGRVGGDEFAVLLPDADVLGAARIAERLRKAVATACRAPGVTASVGAATFRFPPSSVDDMLAAADRLMYRSKEAGGDKVTGAVIPFHVVRTGARSIHVHRHVEPGRTVAEVPLK
jgi:diguanylate cyclase (GGDEF)-like protein